MVDHSDGQGLIKAMPVLDWMGMRWVDSGDPEVYAVELDVTPKLFNLSGVPHGGVIATFIDHAGGAASGFLTGRAGATADLHVRFLRGTRGKVLRAEARIVKPGRQLVIEEVRVTDDLGQLIAIGDLCIAVDSSAPTDGIPDAPDTAHPSTPGAGA